MSLDQQKVLISLCTDVADNVEFFNWEPRAEIVCVLISHLLLSYNVSQRNIGAKADCVWATQVDLLVCLWVCVSTLLCV